MDDNEKRFHARMAYQVFSGGERDPENNIQSMAKAYLEVACMRRKCDRNPNKKDSPRRKTARMPFGDDGEWLNEQNDITGHTGRRVGLPCRRTGCTVVIIESK